MDELESRLEHQLSGLGRVPLAEPEPVTVLRRRARRVRVGRALTSVVAVGAAAAIVAGIVVVGRNATPAAIKHVQVAAPDFVLGDVDAVVLSSTFDADGARAPLLPSVEQTVAHVPGVQNVTGVVDTFAPVITSELPGSNDSAAAAIPPRSPILFSFHEGDVHLVSGRLPEADNEILVDADFLSRTHHAVGDNVMLRVDEQAFTFQIVGTLDLPGVDLTGIPMAAMSVAHQPSQIQSDRLDVQLSAAANGADVRDAIATAIGNGYAVAAPSAISFPDQRLAQVEIQDAYWALLSPDPNERSKSGDGPPSAQEKQNYQKYASLSDEVELRVENVSFLSSDAATLTFRIYYDGNPSPVINAPQSGTATRMNGHWQLGTGTLCSLAAIVGIKCSASTHVTITPPNGYQPVSTLDPEVLHAFDALTDPDATVDQRVAAILGGDSLRTIIADGLSSDAAYSGKVDFTIAGWRSTGATSLEILYSLQTTNGPSTPWPTTASAQEDTDGHWYAPPEYACGLRALASEGCDTTGIAPLAGRTATTAPAVAKHP